jgi:exopolysaccharide biosynthesis polyprenyl glycosylphosphotransferase
VTPELATKLTVYSEPLQPGSDLAGVLGIDSASRRADGAATLARPAAACVRRRAALQRRLLGGADIVAVTFTLGLVLNVDQQRVLLVALAMPLVLVPFKIAGLYDRDDLLLVRSTLDEVPALLQLTALFALGVAITKWLVGRGTLGGDAIAGLWLGTFVAIVTCRSLARWLAGRLSKLERCLVIGDFERARRISERITSSKARATVVASLPVTAEDIEELEESDAIHQLVAELEVDRIVIVPSTTDDKDIVGLIRIAKAVGVSISVLPRMFEVVGSAVEFDDVDGMTMLGIRRFGLSQSSLLVKRSFDLVATSIGLLVAAPVMAAIAVAVRLDSRGSVLFSQVRVGRDGNQFVMFKFRSMVHDAEIQKDGLRVRNEAGAGLFKIADDPRVTWLGRFLRRTSLDELPQLFNVMRGEMSLVGPRPLVVDEDSQVLGLDRSRLHLTPGMTGPWQVLGMRVPMQEMVGIDYLYVANWSLWLDVKILLRTVLHIARCRNV